MECIIINIDPKQRKFQEFRINSRVLDKRSTYKIK
jgi:hypothetical protein